MALKSYDSLLKQIQELVNTAVPGGVIVTSKNVISDLSRLEASDYGSIIKSISDDLGSIIESRIISGLYTTATIPPSNQILVTAGTGTAAGKKYELAADTTLTINLDSNATVYYVVLYGEQILVSMNVAEDQCKIAKIVVPNPGVTSQIVDDKPTDGYDAWIVSGRDVVFGEDQEFDDDSIEKLRDVIGKVLAENIIGNIRLSENLKIINTQGSVELDSNSVKIKGDHQNVLAKFDRNGTYFYDPNGVSLAKFTSTEAFIGNILITKNSIQTRNFATGLTGFQIKDNGDTEFNNGIFRGTLSANVGNIGGWTLAANEMYATDTGTIKTSIDVGAGYNGIMLDKDGLRVYDDVLGMVVNLPSDGSAPSFSSGIIEETIFEINTNAVLRTSETVGLESGAAGILINNTGLYGCGINQILSDANFKVLANGNAYFKGEIQATSGTIGSVTISATALTGGMIIGSLIRGSTFETSITYPKVLINETGMSFQVTSSVGEYGENYEYGTGNLLYGAGVTAYLLNDNYPILSVMAERNLADIRLYNRTTDPVAGEHEIGDLIMTAGELKSCTTAGTPGLFTKIIRENDIKLSPFDTQTFLFNPNLTDDHSVSGLTIWFTAGESVVFADLLYLNNDGKYYKTDADTATTMPAQLLSTSGTSSSGVGLRMGYARDNSWNWTVKGQLLYTDSAISGAIRSGAPSGTGDQVQIIGEAITADIIYFNPNATLIELI